jgi:hypothetical protein
METPMKFLGLICAEKVMEPMPQADATRLDEEYRQFSGEIHASGYLLGAHRLLPHGAAVTRRPGNGKLLTTDGPFAETKEHLGGDCLTETRGLSETIGVAARIPGTTPACGLPRPVAEETATREAPGVTAAT